MFFVLFCKENQQKKKEDGDWLKHACWLWSWWGGGGDVKCISHWKENRSCHWFGQTFSSELSFAILSLPFAKNKEPIPRARSSHPLWKCMIGRVLWRLKSFWGMGGEFFGAGGLEDLTHEKFYREFFNQRASLLLRYLDYHGGTFNGCLDTLGQLLTWKPLPPC